jgi:LysR family transcriptional regulator, transcriptional activator for dmlA
MASELEVFILVADSGGFAGAARRLRLTPSAISRRVALLEDRLGVQLLSRTTRKVELTAAGEAYFQRIKPLLSAIAAAADDLEQFSPVPVGQLVVSAPAALLERKLVGFVMEYLRENPQMRIELIPSELGSNVDYDFTVQSLASSDKNKASIKLTANPWTVCAAPSYLERHGTPDRPQDLQSHNCLIIGTHPHWQFVVDDKELNFVPPSRFISFGSAVHQAAIEGFGIARLAAFLVNDDLRTGRLVKLLGQYSDTRDRDLYLISDADKIRLAKYAGFAEFIKAKFASGF